MSYVTTSRRVRHSGRRVSCVHVEIKPTPFRGSRRCLRLFVVAIMEVDGPGRFAEQIVLPGRARHRCGAAFVAATRQPYSVSIPATRSIMLAARLKRQSEVRAMKEFPVRSPRRKSAARLFRAHARQDPGSCSRRAAGGISTESRQGLTRVLRVSPSRLREVVKQ